MVYPQRKVSVLEKFIDAFSRYQQIMIVDLNNISTDQITKTRRAIRLQKGLVLVGKNSIVRIAVKVFTEDIDKKHEAHKYQKNVTRKPELKNLLSLLKGKICFVFSDKPFSEIKPIVEKEAVKVPAKPGTIAPADIIIQPQQTSIDPGKIIEFQRIGMTVKTNKSALEITKEFKLCGKGELVTETVSAMCRLLNIIPFEYAMRMKSVYIAGEIIPEEFINFDNAAVINLFQQNAKAVTAVCLEANIANALSIPHLVLNTFKSLLAIGIEGNVKFKQLDDALNSKSSAPAPGKPADAKKEPVKETKKEPEPEPVVEDVDLGDMFG